MKSPVSFTIPLLIGLAVPATALAEPTVASRATLDNQDGPGAQFDALWPVDTTYLGAQLRGSATRERYVGGYAVRDGFVAEFRLTSDFALKLRRGARFGLGVQAGARWVQASTSTPQGERSIAPLVALRPGLTVPLSDSLTGRVGIGLDVALAVSPATELDTLANPLEFGLRWRLADRWTLVTDIGIGGGFGYGGDGMKLAARAGLGVAYTPPVADQPDDAKGGIGVFASVEWRAMALAGHASHGPGFSTGVRLLDGWLKVGIAGFNRPGPLNPETFKVKPSDGSTYKGQNELTLRSDGGVAGLLVALHVPVTDSFAVELPVTVGQGAFGFYLTDDDRETPDGRRVSEWENELQDGRDASFGFAVDGGLRAMLTLQSVPWLRPHVGVFYTSVLGYDAFAKGSYDGLSVASGVEVGLD